MSKLNCKNELSNVFVIETYHFQNKIPTKKAYLTRLQLTTIDLKHQYPIIKKKEKKGKIFDGCQRKIIKQKIL